MELSARLFSCLYMCRGNMMRRTVGREAAVLRRMRIWRTGWFKYGIGRFQFVPVPACSNLGYWLLLDASLSWQIEKLCFSICLCVRLLVSLRPIRLVSYARKEYERNVECAARTFDASGRGRTVGMQCSHD